MTVLLGLFATATLYALILSLPLGQEWTHAQTWTTVALGVLVVLGWMWLDDPDAATKALLYFCVGGAPMVVRSLILQFLRHRAILRRVMGEDA